MPADLHLHTIFSDGTFTPEELVSHAKHKALTTISLTDHDTLEGCARARAACESAGIEFISGTELTGEHDGHEVHMLGYFLDETNERLAREIEQFQKVRQERIVKMVEKINERGVPLQLEAVHEIARCKSPGRPHVARALVEQGFCSSFQDAFERFLKKHKPAWVPKCRISVEHSIDLIHEACGLAVLAHPGIVGIDRYIPYFKALGMDGIECFHSRHSSGDTEWYLEVAGKNDLLVTGGSDCHGYNKDEPLIGGVKLEQKYLDAMKEKVSSTTT
jgi:predicted metal-dependent phosphoesterase TrpH